MISPATTDWYEGSRFEAHHAAHSPALKEPTIQKCKVTFCRCQSGIEPPVLLGVASSFLSFLALTTKASPSFQTPRPPQQVVVRFRSFAWSQCHCIPQGS